MATMWQNIFWLAKSSYKYKKKIILSSIGFVKMDFPYQYHIEGETLRSPLRAKDIKDSMLTVDLSR